MNDPLPPRPQDDGPLAGPLPLVEEVLTSAYVFRQPGLEPHTLFQAKENRIEISDYSWCPYRALAATVGIFLFFRDNKAFRLLESLAARNGIRREDNRSPRAILAEVIAGAEWLLSAALTASALDPGSK